MVPFRLFCSLGLIALTVRSGAQSGNADSKIQPLQQTVTVQGAAVDQPDPAASSYRREELLPATPGHPGVPFSVPGFPAETASGGIKAPQYFAPGVAGDHGEPIAQFLDVDGFLIPNNLTANAHGNGYADPNLMIGPTLEGVVADAGAFNARYGDHAINLAVTYPLRLRLEPFLQFATDGKDAGLAAALATHISEHRAWIAAEMLWGNGWLDRPEHRQQFRLTGLNTWTPGRHSVTFLGIGYEGFSHLPGLIPMDCPVPGDTVDERQQDFTHTALVGLADTWVPHEGTVLRTGGFVRRYGLDLRSNFGDGLIRQSERRWVAGADTTWMESLHWFPRWGGWTLLASGGYTLEAPHNLMLQHVVDAPGAPVVPGNESEEGATPQFAPVTRNNLTIQTGYGAAALSGRLLPLVHVYAGGRYDWLCFRNQDLLSAANGFDRCVPIAAPKLSTTFGNVKRGTDLAGWLPEVSISYAHAFHANDPRIGASDGSESTSSGSLVISAHEWQAVARKELAQNTEAHIVVARVANAGELAKLDADTGLQENVGPAVNRYVTVALTHRQSSIFWQASWSEADARDRTDGFPIPEAPRMIADASATFMRLPHGFTAQGEFEYVKAKPLGDGISGTPLTELRMGLDHSWLDGRLTAGLQGRLAQGFSGQTTETLALPGESMAFERAVGVPSAPYASASLNWRLR
jgi:hypothetical protein